MQPEKLVKSAKEIQRAVQEKLKERLDEEESMRKSILEQENFQKMSKQYGDDDVPYQRRSSSMDPLFKVQDKQGAPDTLYSD